MVRAIEKGGPLCHHTMAGIVQGRGGRGLTLTPLFAALPECPLSRMFNLAPSQCTRRGLSRPCKIGTNCCL